MAGNLQEARKEKKEKVIQRIINELEKAENDCPYFPGDSIHGIVMLLACLGELSKVGCDYIYQYPPYNKERKKMMSDKAFYLTIMCIRFLMEFYED